MFDTAIEWTDMAKSAICVQLVLIKITVINLDCDMLNTTSKEYVPAKSAQRLASLANDVQIKKINILF